jgi:hypothetical protein
VARVRYFITCVESTYRISSYSFRGNYSFLNLEIQRSQYINVWKLFKGGNYSRAETVWGNKVLIIYVFILFIWNYNRVLKYHIYRLDGWNGPNFFSVALATASANIVFQVWELPLFSGNCLSCLATASGFLKPINIMIKISKKNIQLWLMDFELWQLPLELWQLPLELWQLSLALFYYGSSKGHVLGTLATASRGLATASRDLATTSRALATASRTLANTTWWLFLCSDIFRDLQCFIRQPHQTASSDIFVDTYLKRIRLLLTCPSAGSDSVSQEETTKKPSSKRKKGD